MKRKNIKKWIAGMMLPVTALSAVGGVVATDYIVNTSSVVKAANSITTYSLVDTNDSTKVKSNKSLVTDGNLYYAKFTNVLTDYQYANFIASEKTTVAQGQNINLTVSNDLIQGDFEGSSFYLFSTHEDFFKFADFLGTVNIDSFDVSMYGYMDFTSYISKTNYAYILDYLMMCKGNSTGQSYRLNASVVTTDETAPTMETQVFLTDIDNPMSLEYILSQVKFIDEVDGELTPTLVTDNYSSNMDKVGKYTIVVTATDKAGNTGTGNIEVWVQDKTKPTITGKSTFTSNMSNSLSEASIRAELSANDNVDGNISNKIQVVSDGFTGNENKKGTYTIKYKVVDNAGNESAVYSITVSVVDDVKPVINVKDGYSDTYTSSYKNTISLETIKSSLIATDNVDGEISVEMIEDKYSGASSIPGIYTISFRATDSAGNISEMKTITITVTDEIPPVFYASGLFIGVSQAQALSHQDIVNILIYMQDLQNEGASVQMLSNEYMVDTINEPGVYRMSYRIVRETGEVGEIQTAEIKVLGEKEVVENDDKTLIEQEAKNVFQKLWDVIKGFVVNLWKSIVKYLGFGWIWDKTNKFDPNW